MVKEGRQVSPTIEGVRDDHVARYRFAVEKAKHFSAKSIADIGSGTGYGSKLLADEAGAQIYSYEADADAVAFAKKNYAHAKVTARAADVTTAQLRKVDMVTAFEVIEHVEKAPELLAKLAGKARVMVGSVPNEAVVPFDPAKHERHVRHYTAGELRDELAKAGWRTVFMGGQVDKRGGKAAVVPTTENVRTLVFVAKSTA